MKATQAKPATQGGSTILHLVEDKTTVMQRLDRLAELRLDTIKNKLQQPSHGGLGWSSEQADMAEKWYLRYLTVVIRFPHRVKHVPNAPVDAFWHQHILDTKKYREDCAHVLGYFLDHNPYYGMGDDKAEHSESFAGTNALMMELYGEDMTSMVSLFPSATEDEGGAYCGDEGATCNNE